MKAAILTRFGGPEVLKIGEVERPRWREDQMLLKVAACGVCGHDLLNREGHFPDTHPPCVMGHEIAGTIEAVGGLVQGFKIGDRVALAQRMSCGLCPACRAGRENLCRNGAGFYGESTTGGYGEYVIASPRNAVLLPEEIDFLAGSILSCAVGTGFHALQRARLVAGDTVVITGASGGVGLHTVDLAHLFGYRVIAVVGSASSAAVVRDAGADEVLAASDGDFHRIVRDLTGGFGADAVIEIAGSPTFGSSIRSLASGGRLVTVGNVRPGPVQLNPALTILKEIEVVGSGHATVQDLGRVIDLVKRGRIRPRIARLFNIEEVAQAHAALGERGLTGRVVLTHSPAPG